MATPSRDEDAREQRTVAGRPASCVTAYPDGPLIVRGDFEVRWADGTPVDTGLTVALCRCGRSATKPLCDGSHRNGPWASKRPHQED